MPLVLAYPSLLVLSALSESPLAVDSCRPLGPEEKVLAVVVASHPELGRQLTWARALVNGAAPFPLASAGETAEALGAESGLRRRRARVGEGRALLQKAETRFSELEDKDALNLIAEATPLLVAAHAEPSALTLLARCHLLAGAIFVARDRLDAAQSRLQRALDIDPDVAPSTNLRLLGVLEAVRAGQATRGQGWLDVRLTGSATAARVYLDGRPIGLAPGRFEAIGVGRHLLRVSAPGHLSYTATAEVLEAQGTELTVSLPADDFAKELTRLGPKLGAGLRVAELQARLRERVGVERTLVAGLVPGTRRSDDGGLGTELILDLEEAGRVRVASDDPEAVRGAARRLAECELGSAPFAWSLAAAPPLPGPGPAQLTTLEPHSPPSPFWTSPWFWGLSACAAILVAGGLAAVHGASAPPDSLSVTLIPRP